MKYLSAVIISLFMFSSSVAHAGNYIVDAAANSSTGGVGLDSVSLVDGQSFTVTSSLTDIWTAGPLPRWSNANGLVSNLYATGHDLSGYSVGTLIGTPFSLWSEGGLSAPYGSLVGQIGSVYRELGANYTGSAWGTGVLKLYYWDEDAGGNLGAISFNVSTVPEPESWMEMMVGLLMVGGIMKSRRLLWSRSLQAAL